MADQTTIIIDGVNLVELIQRSEVINDDEKARYINTLPWLSDDQKRQILTFFTNAENELKGIRHNYEQKKVSAYEKHIKDLDQAIHQANTMVRKELEVKQAEHDEKDAEDAINSL